MLDIKYIYIILPLVGSWVSVHSLISTSDPVRQVKLKKSPASSEKLGHALISFKENLFNMEVSHPKKTNIT